jgi:hypothetical protein
MTSENTPGRIVRSSLLPMTHPLMVVNVGARLGTPAAISTPQVDVVLDGTQTKLAVHFCHKHSTPLVAQCTGLRRKHRSRNLVLVLILVPCIGLGPLMPSGCLLSILQLHLLSLMHLTTLQSSSEIMVREHLL